jgi:hypothetical protein
MSPGKLISLFCLYCLINISVEAQSQIEYPIYDDINNDLRHYELKTVALFQNPLTNTYRKKLQPVEQIGVRAQSIQ